MAHSPDARVCPERVVAELRELQRLTGDDQGAQRVAWTPAWATARAWLLERLSELPVGVQVDEAGNLWATLSGEKETAIAIGSHLDSVPCGGWLDGSLGVVAGLEILRRLARGRRPCCTVRLVDWSDEEGARFNFSLFGSSAACRRLNVADLREAVDSAGEKLPDVLSIHGVDVGRAMLSASRLDDVAAYLELHIEQGPVLEACGAPVGVVTGVVGAAEHAIDFEAAHGIGHSVEAAARVVLELRALAVACGGMSTVGRLETNGAQARLLLDQRHIDREVLSHLVAESRRAVAEIARAEGTSAAWRRIWWSDPLAFDAKLVALAAKSVRRMSGRDTRLPSGALHDAAVLAASGIPSVMLFVQSIGGVSHSRYEDTAAGHLELAVRTLDDLTERVLEACGEQLRG